MYLHISAVLVSTLALVSALGTAPSHAKCNTNVTRTPSGKKGKNFARQGGSKPVKELGVDVYMHVLARPEEARNKKSEFLLTRRDLETQIKTLNDGYKSAKIHFNLKNMDWNVGKLIAYDDTDPEPLFNDQLLINLHKGNMSTLNLYYYNSTDNVGGITSFPSATKHTIKQKGDVHGCIISSNTVLGGSNPRWNQGKTTIHEVGHWLGNNHHMAIADDCGIYDNQCPTLTECHNYMSYSDDKCVVEFNSEQNLHMNHFLEQLHRGISPAYLY